MIRALRVGVFALLSLVTVSGQSAAVPHDVYVWQRQWTQALRTALTDSRDLFAAVRVLVAQAGRDGRWLTTDADPRAFAGDARARIAVVRYDGAGSPPDTASLIPFLRDLLDRWRDGGAAFAGVEIDYDCASARLADYAQRVRLVRAALPADVSLSITALPVWIGESALGDLLAATDEAVLQVHSVQNPRDGLFLADDAERWVRRFAAQTRRDFRVAVPAYGSRIRFDNEGRAIAVENEMAVDATRADSSREMDVDPAGVATLLRRIAEDSPPNLKGIVWFRLPVAGDRRTWTLAAIREVVAGHVPTARISAVTIARDNGAADIFVVNDSVADARASALHVAGSGCSDGDAAAGWQGERVAQGWRFVADGAQRIRAGTRRAVGWVRCKDIAATRVE